MNEILINKDGCDEKDSIVYVRRFAVSVIKSKGARSVAQNMRQLTRNARLAFDYLRMTENSRTRALRH